MKWTPLDSSVFIVGVPRSGTTMLWSILLRHAEFRGEKEIPSWNAETSIFHRFPKLLEEYFAPGKWPFWNEYFVGDKIRFEDWVVNCLRTFILEAAKARGARCPLEKTPNHLENIDLIERAFPAAKIIHIIRHPVDVFASMRKRSFSTPPKHDPWLKVPAERFAHDYERKISKVGDYRGRLPLLSIRYEDLTEDPEINVIRVCKFLHIAPDVSIIYGETPQRRVRKFPLQSPVPIRNSGMWRNAVSEQEVEVIKKITKKTRKRYNYG